MTRPGRRPRGRAKQPVEGDQPHDPDDHDADRQPDRPAPHRTPRPGPILPPARGDEDDRGDRREDPQATEHGPHVGHVSLFARVEDRRAIDLDVEASAKDEVGQDGVGGGPQLLGA